MCICLYIYAHTIMWEYIWMCISTMYILYTHTLLPIHISIPATISPDVPTTANPGATVPTESPWVSSTCSVLARPAKSCDLVSTCH